MLRRSSPVETVLTYATFLAISIAIHMLVILGPPGTTPSASQPETTQGRPAGVRR